MREEVYSQHAPQIPEITYIQLLNSIIRIDYEVMKGT